MENDEKDLKARRESLSQQIAAHEATEARKTEAKRQSAAAGYAAAFRLSTEFVSAIFVGAAIGYGLDYLLGSSPFLTILFFFLGFVAGVLNVLRSSGLIQSPQVGKRPPERGDNP
ncbi:MAG: AtpZ/AtpI family protein [Acuticoccus sp.]